MLTLVLAFYYSILYVKFINLQPIMDIYWMFFSYHFN